MDRDRLPVLQRQGTDALCGDESAELEAPRQTEREGHDQKRDPARHRPRYGAPAGALDPGSRSSAVTAELL
jgi:hypothetical protein